jgi:hypothetical protein
MSAATAGVATAVVGLILYGHTGPVCDTMKNYITANALV